MHRSIPRTPTKCGSCLNPPNTAAARAHIAAWVRVVREVANVWSACIPTLQFTMASRAGVRVVPISIVGTHIFQPPSSIHPLWWPRGIRIIVHPPLPVPTKKTEVATLSECKATIESALHPSMMPLKAD